MPYSASSSQRPYRYGPSRIGTVCLIQIPVAKDHIGTGQAYREDEELKVKLERKGSCSSSAWQCGTMTML
ncbi:hypothetical protein V6N12_069251 [Hibiscus sabdariffa]|uniref:Uncharacterized protein n=1 Tax=Hibiscus sabdariffa TaxID=183260 RepID=A0ABR2FD96_9ROSI